MDRTSTAFSALTGRVRAIWAKSGAPVGHGLLTHMLDVAAVVEILLSREPPSTRHWAAVRFGLPDQYLVRWLSALVGLHDFGKATPGFQGKWSEGRSACETHGLMFPPMACRADRHDLATAALLRKALRPWANTSDTWLQQVVLGISAHHGHPFLPDAVRKGKPLGEPQAWATAREEMLDAYWSTLSPQGAAETETLALPAINWLAGLTSTADWIGSNPDWFPPGERGHADLAAYHTHALSLAANALDCIDWRPTQPLLTSASIADTAHLLQRIAANTTISPRPLQQAGDALLEDVHGPALLLVEAPMGEGKTELALLAHLRLQAANGHRGLYVALPTQATSNAMHHRARRFLDNFSTDTIDLQLIHGGASIDMPIPPLRGIDENPRESVSASSWFSQRRRPLLSHYGIGTVDQALYATLNVKHHFVRLWGLGNRVVVIDEVHAYDTYTSNLIDTLLRWLRALGCSVVLMSATLPAARRKALMAAWNVDPDSIPELPYPRILLADTQGCRGRHFESRKLPDIVLHGLTEDLQDIAAQGCALLASGGCGAVIVNTVDRAQKLYLALRDKLPPDVPLMLFHARYPADERSARERMVLSRFGPDGERPERALLVATQVVEQSLDLDFDFMLTDLAPVDLLLQRAGRLHRHDRTRPAAHAQARLHVAGLLPDKLPDLTTTKWKFVYDAFVLGRTWALLRRETTLQLPGDIDRLVQSVYDIDTPLPEPLDPRTRDLIEVQAYGEYLSRTQNQERESTGIVIHPDDALDTAYADKPDGHDPGDGTGLMNKTRTGPESITLIPVEVVEDGWQEAVSKLTFKPSARPEDVLASSLHRRRISVSSHFVVQKFKKQLRLGSFSEHPLLEYCFPLPLQECSPRTRG